MEDTKPVHHRYPCPCCGYLTYSEPPDGGYDICSVCFWEDDLSQRQNPTMDGGANQVSLLEAKVNFKAFGAAEERLVKFVRPPTPEGTPE